MTEPAKAIQEGALNGVAAEDLLGLGADDVWELVDLDAEPEVVLLGVVLLGVLLVWDGVVPPLVGVLDPPEPEGLPPLVGGSSARDGSSSAPTPHGIGSPSGWVALGGGVVSPLGPAIVNRVVQRVVPGTSGDVNW